ncbi:F/Y rich C-terminus-domain-containing protein [Chlamydoabsidia padenii]|nr:F/Y rich C-terminus-domain-containing protein [Chlamydoabsidia padenii]
MDSNISSFATTNAVPEEKYNIVKQRLKEMTEKNDALTNDLNHAKKQLRRLAHEKIILLEKLSEDEPMGNNESNENCHTSLYPDDDDIDSPQQQESSKKDLHLLTDDESQQLQAQQEQRRSIRSLHSPSSPMDATLSISKQEKPPDLLQQHDQLCTPHTPVPSTLREDPTLPTLPSTILKHTTLPPLHHHHHHHHHHPHLPSTLSPPTNTSSSNNINKSNNNNNGSSFISCADYNSTIPSHPLEPTAPNVSPPLASSSLSPSTTASSTSPSSSNDTLNSANSNKTDPLHHHHHHHQGRHTHHRYHHKSPLESGRNCTMVPSSRPKRMRRGNQEPKMRRVQPLPRDPITGEYRLPAHVGILTVHSLGRVVPLTTYHNDRYIWPPGFKVSRTYLSMVNSDQNTVYTCTVEENGEQGPRFRVIAEDSPDQPIVANSATGVWTAIVKRANEIRNREHSNSASGPDYYGFTHATIAKMIQDLPGADQCLNYVWQKFGVMQQRTAAGVAAAAQKKLANLEIMGSANKRAPPPLGEGFVLNKDTDHTNDRKLSLPTTSQQTPLLLSTSSSSNTSSSAISSPSISSPLRPSPITTTTTTATTATAPIIPLVTTIPPHRQLPTSSPSSVLPSLATMTSTAAAAAAAVEQTDLLNNNNTAISSPSSSSSTSSSSLSPTASHITSNLRSTSLQHHSLRHHHRHHPSPATSDISVWSTLTR